MVGKKSTGIKVRRNKDGSVSFDAQLFVTGFKRVQQSFATRAEALAWREKLKTELSKHQETGGVREDVATLTIAELAKEYLADPETQAQRAFQDRKNCVTWWVNHYGGERVRQFNVLKIRTARDKLKPGRQPATINRYLASMRACWNWGIASGLVQAESQWPKRLMLSEPKGRTRFLTDDEIARVLKASADQGPVMYAAVLVSIACGMRKGELLRLRWGDVDFDAQTLRILVTKNGESRGVHLPPSAANALRALRESKVVALDGSVFMSDEGEPIGQGWIEYRWRSVTKEAGLRDFRWHDLRHSCASILAQNGASLPEIGSVLGHQSAAATFRYSHLVAGKVVKGHAALDAKLRGAP
jgi:integrase